MSHKLFIRRFPRGIPKSTGRSEQVYFIDEFVSDLEAVISPKLYSFNLSGEQVLMVPHFDEFCPTPQWGFVLDNSRDDQSTYPALVVKVGEFLPTQQTLLRREGRVLQEYELLNSLIEKFPKTFG